MIEQEFAMIIKIGSEPNAEYKAAFFSLDPNEESLLRENVEVIEVNKIPQKLTKAKAKRRARWLTQQEKRLHKL